MLENRQQLQALRENAIKKLQAENKRISQPKE